jgi:hypothetical protein
MPSSWWTRREHGNRGTGDRWRKLSYDPRERKQGASQHRPHLTGFCIVVINVRGDRYRLREKRQASALLPTI